MKATVSDILAARSVTDGGLTRLVGWSLAAHIVVGAAAVFLPTGWLATQPEEPEVLMISLGGAVGPRSTGTAPIAGRQVDEVADTRRPEPPKPPAAAKPDEMPPPISKPTPPKPTPPPPKTTAPPAAVTKPPVTGAQVQTGTAAADTGAAGNSQGLTLTGGGGGGDTDLSNFDPEWTAKFQEAIRRVWQRLQPEVGFVVLRFTVLKDGSIKQDGLIPVIDSSGSFPLQQVSRRAVIDARLPPLPAGYTELTVRLRFEYERGRND